MTEYDKTQNTTAKIRPIIKIPTSEISLMSCGDLVSVNNDMFLSSYLASMNLELEEQDKTETDYVVVLVTGEETWLMPKNLLTVKLIREEYSRYKNCHKLFGINPKRCSGIKGCRDCWVNYLNTEVEE